MVLSLDLMLTFSGRMFNQINGVRARWIDCNNPTMTSDLAH